MKHRIYYLIGIIVLVLAGYFYWQNFRGVGPAINPPPKTEEKNNTPQNTTGMPLVLPDGFSIEIFAKDLPGARVIAFDREGDIWVSRTSDGAVAEIELKNGQPVKVEKPASYDFITGLSKPHGLAFNDDNLFIAEENKIFRISPKVSDLDGSDIISLPTKGGGHFTRTLGFGPDGRLYVSIGSSCNVCNEDDPRRAAIYSLNEDGSDFKRFAKGLRNTVFFTWNTDGKMWGSDMGRDYLGDDLPPDEINMITEGLDYGWPNCYGSNVPDPFSPNCENKMPSQVDLPAHSAPLGLAFVPHDSNWPKDYWGDLIVAFHGSWNRSVPTGYKLVRVKIDENTGKSTGMEDFVTGWLQGNSALGRPVDVKFHGDALYVSDDKAGVIYRISSKY